MKIFEELNRKEEGFMRNRVLVIAGFDPSGGAGLLMDIKILTLLGYKACAIPTAITFQSSKVFENWDPLEIRAFEKMLKLTLEDKTPEGVKIGMLAIPEIVEITAFYLRKTRDQIKWIVFDPVLVATLEMELFRGEDFMECLKREIFPLTDVITPNVKEAEILTGFKITLAKEAEKALENFKIFGINFPVITGFEEDERKVCFYLDERGKIRKISVKKLNTEFHGTGCAFSSALLAFLLKGEKRI